MNDIPLIRPNPPRLSRLIAELAAIEASGTFSNNGPVCRRFEAAATKALFGGRGACLAVANATLGLMIALRYQTRDRAPGGLALMPSFTFAATGHAAAWAGLTPLLCDIGRDDWTMDLAAAETLLRAHRGKVAAIVPYATFGAALDLDRYDWLARRYDAALVVDAAASLGSLDADGRGFGAGSRAAIVYSMHATKTFATGEGGLIHSGDRALVEALRAMTNFGFESGRSATLPGLNAKLTEVGALLALEKLGGIEAVASHRAILAERYRAELDGFALQAPRGLRQPMQFMSALLPPALAGGRGWIVDRLAAQGIGAATYFSPHLAEQPWFRDHAESGPLPVTDDIAARILALPITDAMTLDEVSAVCAALKVACLEAAQGAGIGTAPGARRRAVP